ncbi:Arginase/deacetylase [Laetiporus sulphureus 93-53]|uniref:Arginase/deacetylase n=1 Tax=Laetiporus sulphureus 93-53 TaxID=1314785 RepID=A0A165FLN7_9APHY|nr:Arginase/deacetylase [Laetiporus sulphureus 93-53]KZT09156.1 Arginase/deacetylase [Laetiporus sulphureus 93-53]
MATSEVPTASNRQTAVFLQKACLRHHYIRSRDTSCIVERPERLRAVNIGLAAAVARLEDIPGRVAYLQDNKPDADELVSALGRLDLASSESNGPSPRVPVHFVHSDATVDILNNPAVKFVHGDIDGDVYLENLKNWAKMSKEKVEKGDSEIPETLSQGDLYLCPESIDAIQGALGTVCQAVDIVVNSLHSEAEGNVRTSQAFVAIRPPGHHCGEDTPSGFCFVNNVAVAAAHAHLRHGINRVVILDIDLHHGNGTQSIVWQINEETYRKSLEQKYGAPPGKPGLQIYYGSLHDVLSYPCEDGKAALVQAASVSIHGPHGQHIQNIHLRPYSSKEQFWDELYSGPYAKLIGKAAEFLDSSGGQGDDVMVFISCGFDASEHEYPSMSRHKRQVPTTFYHRFARDARAFAERFARGRLISVLEGGYSDRALTSGALAHLTGLAHTDHTLVDEIWWSEDSLIQLEKATKRHRGGKNSQATQPAPWLERTLEVFAQIDSSHTMPTTSSRAAIPPSSRVLRERKNPAVTETERSSSSSPSKESASARKDNSISDAKGAMLKQESEEVHVTSGDSKSESSAALSDIPGPSAEPKKLPRVILRLGPRRNSPS